jgi:SAM-dependent methyltransferase
MSQQEDYDPDKSKSINPPMKSSTLLYDYLAPTYDSHFREPHRAAYDELAWSFVRPLLPEQPGVVIDAGCGNGRWAGRLVGLGHQVIGIEQAPVMAEEARARLCHHFTLIEEPMEQVDDHHDLHRKADVVLALGSIQYTSSPEYMIGRFSLWAKVGGWVAVLVDSLGALVLELISRGRTDEARDRLARRMGTWVLNEEFSADIHLFDSDRLIEAFRQVGLSNISTHGLLVGASAMGVSRLTERLTADWHQQMALERHFAASSFLADFGKHVMVIGQRL